MARNSGWLAPIALAVGLGLTACATGSGHGASGKSLPDGGLKLHASTWDYYQQYLHDIGSAGTGAFAVSVDGRSAFYNYCPGVGCIRSADYRYQAMKGCEAYGQDCVIFAFDRDILVPYQVLK
jgi:hypothetical protein